MAVSRSATQSKDQKYYHARVQENELVSNMDEDFGRRQTMASRGVDELETTRKVQPSEQRRQPGIRQNASKSLPSPRAPRTRQPRQIMGFTYTIVALILCWLVTPAAGVFVSFQNCLPVSYQNNLPRALQFVPLFVNASFDTKDPNHNLQVTVWGNVTGAYTTDPLPAPDSPDWTSDNVTLGKIEDAIVKRTSISKKVTVLTYQAWKEVDGFCDEITNGSCPLAPSFNADPYVAFTSSSCLHDALILQFICRS